MATYVKDKSCAFKKVGDVTDIPTKQRSESRLKAYTSATDARAWGNNIAENKQYILDLMGTQEPKHQQPPGKYVPVEVLVKTLMGNKDADIKRLNAIVMDLEAFINRLDLSPDELRHYKQMKANWGAGDVLIHLAKVADLPKHRPASESRLKKPHVVDSPRTVSESRIHTPRSDIQPSSSGSDIERMTRHQQPRSLARTHYDSPKIRKENRTDSDSSAVVDGHDKPKLVPVQKSHKDVQVKPTVHDAPAQTDTDKKQVEDKNEQVSDGDLPKLKVSCPSSKCRIPVPVHVVASHPGQTHKALTPSKSSQEIDIPAEVADAQHVPCPPTCDCAANKEIARRAVEQLESLKDILKERDLLQEQLRESQVQMQGLKDQLGEKGNCDDEITAMATEVERLKASGTTDELKIVNTELQLLKKYCQKLIYIRDENKKLREENESLMGIAHKLSPPPVLKEYHTPVMSISSNESMGEDQATQETLKRQLLAKISALKVITRQRDKLQGSVTRLEAKLKKYDNLSNEIEMFKERSKVLDSVIEEKMDLERRLENVSTLERDLLTLKQRADKADELQRALENAQNKLLQMPDGGGFQLHMTPPPPPPARVSLEPAGSLEELKYKMREAEVLRLERDRMRIRVEELTHIEQEFKLLQNKYRQLEAVRNERDIYKNKTDELSSLKEDYHSLREQADHVHALSDERDTLMRKMCDLECVIADQENEISRLVLHIDRLSKGQDRQQDRAKQVVSDLRLEVDKKNALIATSEEQLAQVQAQLKETIDKLTNETLALRQQVAEANASCDEMKGRLDTMTKQLSDANVALDREKMVCRCYKAEMAVLAEENGRLQEIAERVEDLTDAGKIESILRKSNEVTTETKPVERASFSTTTPTITIAGTFTGSITETPRHSQTLPDSGLVDMYDEREAPPSREEEEESAREAVVVALAMDYYDPQGDHQGDVEMQIDETPSTPAPPSTATPSHITMAAESSAYCHNVCPPCTESLPTVSMRTPVDVGYDPRSLQCICETPSTPAPPSTAMPSHITIAESNAYCHNVCPPCTESLPTVSTRPPVDVNYESRSLQRICVDDPEMRRRLQESTQRGERNLDNVKCVCKGVQSTRCPCQDVVTSVAPSRIASDECPCDRDKGTDLRQLLARLERELEDCKKHRDTLMMENQALRKHAAELKEVARNQITSLSNELRKSKEGIALTDDSKAVTDLLTQNKLLLDEVAMLKKIQCDCRYKQKQKEQQESQQESQQERPQERQKDEQGSDEIAPRSIGMFKVSQPSGFRTKSLGLHPPSRGGVELPAVEDTVRVTNFDQPERLPLDKSNSDLLRQLEELKRQNTLLRADGDKNAMLDLQRKLDQCKEQNNALESQIKKQENADLDRLMKQLQECKDKLAEAGIAAPPPPPPTEKLKTQDSKQQLMDEIANLRKLLADCRVEGEQVPVQVHVPEKDAKGDDRLAREVDDLRKQLAQCRDKLAENERQPAAPGDAQLAKDNNDLRKQLEQMKRELEQARLKEPAVKDPGAGKEGDGAAKMENEILGKRLQQCTDELDSLRKQLENCRKDIESQKKQVDSGPPPPRPPPAGATDDNLKKQNEELLRQLDKMRKELESAERPKPSEVVTKPTDTSKDLDDLKRQLEQLRKQLEDSNKRLEECQKHLEDEKRKLDEEKKKAGGDNKEMEDLRKQLEAAKKEQLEKGVNQKELDDLRKQLADCRKQLEEEKKKETAKRQPEEDKPKGGPSQKDLDDLRKQLEECRTQLDEEKKKKPPSNQQELDDLRRQIEMSKKELQEEKAKPVPTTAGAPPTGPSQKELDDLKKQLEECKKRLEEEKNKTPDNRQQKELDDLRRQLLEEKNKAPPDVGARGPSQKELDDLKKQLEESKKRLEEEKNKTPDNRQQKELDDLRRQLLEEKNKAPPDVGARGPSQKELDDLKKQLEESKKRLEEEKNKTPDNRQQKELDDLRRQLLEEKNKTPPDVGARGPSQKELDDLKKQLEEARKQAEESRKLLETENKKQPPPGVDQTELDRLRKQLEESKKQLEESKKQVEQEKPKPAPPTGVDTKELDMLRKQLEDARRQAEESKKLLEAEKKKPPPPAGPGVDQKELDNLRKQLEDCRNQVEEGKKLLESEKKKDKPPAAAPGVDQNELDKLRKQLDDFKNQVEEGKKLLENEKRKDKPPAAGPGVDQKELDRLRKQLEDCKNQVEEGKKLLENEKKKDKPPAAAPGVDQKELDKLRQQLEESRKQLEAEKKKVPTSGPVAGGPVAGGLKPPAAGPGVDQKELDKLRQQLEESRKQLEAEKTKVPTIGPVAGGPGVDQKELDKLRKLLEDCKNQVEEGKKLLENERKKDKAPAAGPGVDQKELDKLRQQLEESRKQLAEEKNKVPTSGPVAGGLNKPPAAGPGVDQKELDKLRQQLEESRKQLAEEKKKVPTVGPVVGGPGVDQKELDALRKQLEDCKKQLESEKMKVLPPAGPGVDQKELDMLRKQLEDAKKQVDESKKQPQVATPGAPNQKDLEDLRKQLADCRNELEQERRKPSGPKDTAKLEKTAIEKPTDNAYNDLVRQLQEEKERAQKMEETIAKGDNEDYKRRLAELQEKLRACETRAELYKESGQKLETITRELEDTKRQSLNAISATRTSYERDIKNLQKNYVDGIEKLQASHEEIISQGNRELEIEIESLRKETVEKQATIDDLRCICYAKESKKKKPTLCQVQVQCCNIAMECVCEDMLFAYLLRKVLYCGLESLTFEDLQHMHTTICDATAKVMGSVQRQEGDTGLSPCACDRRRRQTQAKTQVAQLHMEVALERQRLENLKKALEIERSTQVSMTEHFQRQARLAMMPPCPPRSRVYMPGHLTASTSVGEMCYGFDPGRCASAAEINPKPTRAKKNTCRGVAN